jgi:glucose-6-phosphate dehydrogenase assembly protein OpcA
VSTPEQTAEFTSGKPVGVDVAAIERELDALWRQASEHDAVMRARCWNLAAYAQTDADFLWARELTEMLGTRLPTRTLLLHNQPHLSGQEVEAWVSARCKLGPGGTKLLCFEEITIETQGKGVKHLPSLVRALVESDTPTAVLWAGRPPEDPSVTLALLAGADVLLLDTSRDYEPGDLASLELQASVGHVELADAQWLRAAAMREALAQAFDGAKAGPASSIEKVTIRHQQSVRTSGLYLAGWLASRLSWGTPERTEPRRESFVFTGQGQPVRLELEPHERDTHCGISEVSVSLWSGASIEARQLDDAIEVRLPDARPLRVATAPFRPGELLAAALSGRGRDRLFAAALHRASELDRAR